jgi:hypothetical protein
MGFCFAWGMRRCCEGQNTGNHRKMKKYVVLMKELNEHGSIQSCAARDHRFEATFLLTGFNQFLILTGKLKKLRALKA